jgi:hypothetical protein
LLLGIWKKICDLFCYSLFVFVFSVVLHCVSILVIQAAITKYHRLGGLYKVPDDLFSCDCSFPALKTAGYLLYLHMTFVQGAWKDKDLHLPIRTIIPS